jgi:hypothetical protein
MIVMN